MESIDDVKDRYDAVIVGARCAGAATAMLLARRGLDVLCVDRAPYGADTLSTHALMRGGVERLVAWGLGERLVALGAPKVRTVTFAYDGRATEVAIRGRDGVDGLYAPRRHALDALLVDAARASGADVRHGVRLDDVLRGPHDAVAGVRLADRRGVTRRVSASLVIGADGRASRVARSVRAKVRILGGHATSIRYGYFEGLGLEGYHWLYAHRVAAGLIPTSQDLTNVFVATRPGDPATFMDALEAAAPAYADRVRRAPQVGRLRAYPGHPGHLREAAGPGWALVGDAGAYRDPITAHGMSDALADAELLADAVASPRGGGLADYERRRDARTIEVLGLGDRIASFDWSLVELETIHRALSEAMQRSRLGSAKNTESTSARHGQMEERPWRPTSS